MTSECGSKNKLREKLLSAFGLERHAELSRAASGPVRAAGIQASVLIPGAGDWVGFLSLHVFSLQPSNTASLSTPQLPHLVKHLKDLP